MPVESLPMKITSFTLQSGLLSMSLMKSASSSSFEAATLFAFHCLMICVPIYYSSFASPALSMSLYLHLHLIILCLLSYSWTSLGTNTIPSISWSPPLSVDIWCLDTNSFASSKVPSKTTGTEGNPSLFAMSSTSFLFRSQPSILMSKIMNPHLLSVRYLSPFVWIL